MCWRTPPEYTHDEKVLPGRSRFKTNERESPTKTLMRKRSERRVFGCVMGSTNFVRDLWLPDIQG